MILGAMLTDLESIYWTHFENSNIDDVDLIRFFDKK